jgi:hypothetical protein
MDNDAWKRTACEEIRKFKPIPYLNAAHATLIGLKVVVFALCALWMGGTAPLQTPTGERAMRFILACTVIAFLVAYGKRKSTLALLSLLAGVFVCMVCVGGMLPADFHEPLNVASSVSLSAVFVLSALLMMLRFRTYWNKGMGHGRQVVVMTDLEGAFVFALMIQLGITSVMAVLPVLQPYIPDLY